MYENLLNADVVVRSYRNDLKIRTGVCVKVATNKAGEAYFVIESADGSYHTFKASGSPDVSIFSTVQ